MHVRHTIFEWKLVQARASAHSASSLVGVYAALAASVPANWDLSPILMKAQSRRSSCKVGLFGKFG